MNRASSPTGWVRNPAMINPDLDPNLASSYELGYTYNPFTGCLNHTPEGLCLGGMFPCYAHKLANGRLKSRYLANSLIAPFADGIRGAEFKARNDPFYPRFWEERLYELYPISRTRKGIFVCDMSDLFGTGIPEGWTSKVMNQIELHPEHRSYLLTKQPQNLPQWSPFPENCFVGVSVTRNNQLADALKYLKQIQATVKFISFEPLLDQINLDIASSIGYNTEYESEKQRKHSLHNGKSRGIGNRFRREDLESQGTEVGQVEGGKQSDTVCPSQSGERYREISSSKNNGERDSLPCLGTQAGLVSLQGSDTRRKDSQSQKRAQQGQLPRESGTSNIQPTDKAFNRSAWENLQTGQTWPISWLIIGSCTGQSPDLLKLQQQYPSLTLMPYGKKWTLQPQISWVEEIVRACDKAGIPVFLKDNLMPLLPPATKYDGLFYRVSLSKEGNRIKRLRQSVMAFSGL